MNSEIHDEQAESIGAYALGALPELEAQVFERHLMGCQACQEELHRLNEAVEALPRSVPLHDPPPSLKAKLMDVVEAEAEPARRPRRSWLPSLPRLRPAIALASVALAFLAAGYAISQVSGDDDGARTLSAQVDESRLGQASASLSVPDEGGSVLRVADMPELERGRVYQVWVERAGKVEPVSIFGVDARGAGAAGVPEPLDGVSAVMVTREPRGGSAVPSESPVLRFEV